MAQLLPRREDIGAATTTNVRTTDQYCGSDQKEKFQGCLLSTHSSRSVCWFLHINRLNMYNNLVSYKKIEKVSYKKSNKKVSYKKMSIKTFGQNIDFLKIPKTHFYISTL